MQPQGMIDNDTLNSYFKPNFTKRCTRNISLYYLKFRINGDIIFSKTSTETCCVRCMHVEEGIMCRHRAIQEVNGNFYCKHHKI